VRRLLLALAVLSAGAPEAAEAPPWPSRAPLRPNAEMARDILDLAFALEDGRPVPGLGRFEGPVRVRVRGAAPPTLAPDLAALLGRLADEAGLDVALARPDEAAGVVVEAVPGAALAEAVPGAACFVVPGPASWAEFLALRGSPALDWTAEPRRTRAAVFVPADAAPQELRDCLHEEVAQALGPLNDLSGLAGSAFNDDDAHGALTAFDMLALRALNDPGLATGMTRRDVAARLPAILARLNPAGERAPGGDARAGLALLARGRARAGEPEAALAAFRAAEAALADIPVAALHRSQAQAQLAGFALSRGDAAEVLRLTGEATPAAEAEGDAALLATLLWLRAEAMEDLGEAEAARGLRLDGMAWARYGFGDGAEARLAEVRALSPWHLAALADASRRSP
jgi:hypothetical protein